MSDLNGDDAFRIVLDKLVEETNSRHMIREQLGDAHGIIRRLESAAATDRVTIDRLKAQVTKYIGVATPPLVEFYAAAEGVLDLITDAIKGGAPFGADHATLTRLSKAMVAAKNHFDEIPF